MNRRDTGLALLGLLAFGTLPRAAGAQQAGKIYRIGYLSTPTRDSVKQGSKHLCESCASSAGSMVKISSSSTDGPKGMSSACLPSPPNWSSAGST